MTKLFEERFIDSVIGLTIKPEGKIAEVDFLKSEENNAALFAEFHRQAVSRSKVRKSHFYDILSENPIVRKDGSLVDKEQEFDMLYAASGLLVDIEYCLKDSVGKFHIEYLDVNDVIKLNSKRFDNREPPNISITDGGLFLWVVDTELYDYCQKVFCFIRLVPDDEMSFVFCNRFNEGKL